ncbi:MAG: OsmC family protein [Oligoflexia bacterium]|nr:OsmC family protein [Oligoflexia bacterium]
MSVEVTGSYIGAKKVELVHGPSGERIVTSAPKDNQGDGSKFSPTDLVGASMGSCMLTIMAIYAEQAGIRLDGTWFRVEKTMRANPRQIGKLQVDFHLPGQLNGEQRKKLEECAMGCPVHRSLRPEVEVPVTFHYDVVPTRP